jgi:hypothetical protein
MNIVNHICAVNDAAADYRQIILDTESDDVLRELMLRSHGFECAKRAINEHRATLFGPVCIVGTKASMCLVVEQRAVFVVVCVVTGAVKVVSDERARRVA